MSTQLRDTREDYQLAMINNRNGSVHSDDTMTSLSRWSADALRILLSMSRRPALECTDGYQRTALHLAALMGNEQVAKHLIQAGANVSPQPVARKHLSRQRDIPSIASACMLKSCR